MIKFKNVVKHYSKNNSTEELNFTVEDNTIYLLVGKNGYGKSTAIKLICKHLFLTKKDKGKIINSFHKISLLPEKVELPSYGYIYYYLKNIKKLYKSSKNIKKLMLEFNLKNIKFNELSKGMRQKVAIIQVLLVDANLYIFDEPCDGLDKLSIETFIKILKEMIVDEKTIIISTHNEQTYREMLC